MKYTCTCITVVACDTWTITVSRRAASSTNQQQSVITLKRLTVHSASSKFTSLNAVDSHKKWRQTNHGTISVSLTQVVKQKYRYKYMFLTKRQMEDCLQCFPAVGWESENTTPAISSRFNTFKQTKRQRWTDRRPCLMQPPIGRVIKNTGDGQVMGARRRNHMTPVLCELHWLPVPQ